MANQPRFPNFLDQPQEVQPNRHLIPLTEFRFRCHRAACHSENLTHYGTVSQLPLDEHPDFRGLLLTVHKYRCKSCGDITFVYSLVEG